MLFWISRSIFELFIRIMFKLRIHGRENCPKAPFLAVSNHASLVDPPLLAVACKPIPVNFMAKRELFDAPIIGAWTRRVRCIEVHRGENSVRSLKEAIRRLKDGEVVGMFPEGTRSLDGELQDAKRGTGFLVAQAKVPVLPVYIHGSAQAMGKGSGIKRGTPIDVYVGKPIDPSEMVAVKGDKDRYDKISQTIMDRIAEIKVEVENMESRDL